MPRTSRRFPGPRAPVSGLSRSASSSLRAEVRRGLRSAKAMMAACSSRVRGRRGATGSAAGSRGTRAVASSCTTRVPATMSPSRWQSRLRRTLTRPTV